MQLSVFSRVGSLSDLLQTVGSYMRVHAKAQVKTTKPLFKAWVTINAAIDDGRYYVVEQASNTVFTLLTVSLESIFMY